MARVCVLALAAALALSSALCVSGQALFPPLSSTVNVQATATATCGSPREVFAGVWCDAACPLRTAQPQPPQPPTEESGDGDASTPPPPPPLPTIQPECTCQLPTEGMYTELTADTFKCCKPGSSDCVSRLNPLAHPIQFAVDKDTTSYWQSPQGFSVVEVTLDLLAVREILQLDITFATPRPKAMVLQKSMDGVTWLDYQFFAWDCLQAFGMLNNEIPKSTLSVVCVTSESSADKNTVSFSPLDPRRPPTGSSRDYARNPELQQFAQSRYLKLSLRNYHTQESARDPFGNPLPTFPYYAISDVKIQSRCFCNGHASACILDVTRPPSETCDCRHNTKGSTCGTCLDLFNAKPWRQGITGESAYECKQCECNNHATSCFYNATLDSNPSSRDLGNGGQCINCFDNTAGPRCETCLRGFYENPMSTRSSKDSCLSCDCNVAGQSVVNAPCDIPTGKCACKRNVEGRRCDTCIPGTYGLRQADPDGCRFCLCNEYGTVNGTGLCDPLTGQCPCKSSHQDRDCSKCALGFFKSPTTATGICTPCDEECGALGCIAAGSKKTVECLDCKNFENEGVCVSSCPSNKYSRNKVCLPCSDECSGGCTGPDPTTKDCVACKNFEFNGQCVSVCPALTFPDAQRKCIPCNGECARGCFGQNANQCTACRAFNNAGTCVSACPVGMFADDAQICQPCHSECGSEGCTGPGSTACKACRTLQRTLSNGFIECISACDTREYVSDRTCLPCNSECLHGCSGPLPNQCVGECARFKYLETCVASCPVSTYISSGKFCSPCDSMCSTKGCTGPLPSQCNTCAETAFTHINNDGLQTCVSVCPGGTYPNSARICMPCDASCDLCTGPTPSECSKCKFALLGSTCVPSCPTTTTYSTIPAQGYSGIETPVLCLACDAECSKDGCRGPLDTQCVSCKNVKFGQRCLTECPPMTYLNAGVCLPCNDQCAQGCTGPAATQCLSCKKYFDTSLGCTSACSPQKYIPPNAVSCASCHPLCSTSVPGCVGPTSSDCFACSLFENSGMCVTACPYGTWANGTSCAVCDKECDGCTGSGPRRCITCRHAMHDGTCVSECPAGFFAGPDRVCARCHSQCGERCTGAGADKCSPTEKYPTGCLNFLEGSICVSACNSLLYFPDSRTKICQACHSTCETCSGPLATNCTTCSGNRYLSSTSCLSCHPQCEDGGCRGPTSQDCKYGCKTFTDFSTSSAGVCVSACPSNTYVSDTPVPRSCLKCHSQCNGGCVGPAPDQCKSCKNVKSGTFCVSECPANQHPNQDKFCAPCNEECLNGCDAPGDPLSCRECKHFKNEGRCVSSCPTSKLFADGIECLSECPTSRPFYNDTRQVAPNTRIVAACVSDCLQLNDITRTFVSKDFPYRCTTKAQASADTSGEGTTAYMGLYIAIAVCGSVILLVLVILLVRRSGKSKSAAVITPAEAPVARQQLPRANHPNPVYGQGAAKTPRSVTLDNYPYDTNDVFSPNAHPYIDDNSYMEVGHDLENTHV